MLKLLKKLKSLVPHQSHRNYGRFINVTEEHIEQTDGFSLLRLKNRSKLEVGMYTKESLNQYIVAGVSKPENYTVWPNTDAVFPTREHTSTITVNAKILCDLLKVLQTTEKVGDGEVVIEIHGDGPIVLTNNQGDQGLIVPIKKGA